MSCFITGTDTDCGKTEVSLGLMAAWQARGARALGMKPVASGCLETAEGLRNADALRLLAQGSLPLPYPLVNPYAFAPAIAPHLAAAASGVRIEPETIAAAYAALETQGERIVVEGVGGWRVPLGEDWFVSDLPRLLELPVILVVGLRLGCINHALLTAEAIRGSGCVLAGWVANRIDPRMLAAEETLATLMARLDAPCLGVVPWTPEPTPRVVAESLHPELMLIV